MTIRLESRRGKGKETKIAVLHEAHYISHALQALCSGASWSASRESARFQLVGSVGFQPALPNVSTKVSKEDVRLW